MAIGNMVFAARWPTQTFISRVISVYYRPGADGRMAAPKAVIRSVSSPRHLAPNFLKNTLA